MTVFALLLVALSTPGLLTADRPVDRVWDGRSRTIHEWGTFVSVQGSDGVALDGLRHHDRDLPDFVHALERKGGITALALKMETPVVYFYAPGTWRLDLGVRFPRGLVTEWWPSAALVNLPCERDAEAVRSRLALREHLRDGFVTWGRRCDLVVLPPDTEVELAPVDPADPWGFAREVAANPLRVARHVVTEESDDVHRPEHEKLLFYRGLGDFPLPLAVRVREERKRVQEFAGPVRSLVLDLELPPGSAPLRGLFVLEVEGDRAGFAHVGDVGAARRVELEFALSPLVDTTKELERAVADELSRAGLFSDEARAMTRTWAHAWFGEPGLRVLYVLPPEFVEHELPLTTSHGVLQPTGRPDWIEAPPESIVRVFVARTEVLTPSTERRMIETIEKRARNDERADLELAAWGRYAPPRLERLRALLPEGELRATVEALIRERREH